MSKVSYDCLHGITCLWTRPNPEYFARGMIRKELVELLSVLPSGHQSAFAKGSESTTMQIDCQALLLLCQMSRQVLIRTWHQLANTEQARLGECGTPISSVTGLARRCCLPQRHQKSVSAEDDFGRAGTSPVSRYGLGHSIGFARQLRTALVAVRCQLACSRFVESRVEK